MLFISSCGCVAGQKKPYREPSYSFKDLKQIIIRGRYFPENKNKVAELKIALEEEINSESPSERIIRSIKRQLSKAGKEDFKYFQDMYCYNEIEEKESVFNENLRARLYDEEGILLSEDFLRVIYPDKDDIYRDLISYLSYHNKGYKTFIVRLDGKKEVILNELKTHTQSELERKSHIDIPLRQEGERWVFNQENECHISPIYGRR